MTEIFRNRTIGQSVPEFPMSWEPGGRGPKQVLVDSYHPEYPAIKPAKVVRRSSEEDYLKAKLRKELEMLADDPDCILPHHPCG